MAPRAKAVAPPATSKVANPPPTISPPPASGRYSFEQLEQLWIQAGGSQEWAPTMAAIALGAESGGDPTITNPSGATGLWQIEVPGSAGGFTAQQLKDPLTNAKRAVQLLGNGAGISNWGNGTGDSIGTYIQNNGNKPLSPDQARQFASSPPASTGPSGASGASLTPNVNNQSQGNQTTPPPTTPPATKGPLLADIAGSGIVPVAPIETTSPEEANYKGFNLTAIPANELATAKQDIDNYLIKPGYKAKVEQNIAADYGYSAGWIQKIPELYGVLIWASLSLDPSSQTDMNLVLGAIRNTSWYQQTNQNVRAWDQAASQDPANAQQQLNLASEHVIATANQVGVTLTKSQVTNIAQMYAANAYTPTGVLGAQSGTTQDWLDQAVIDTALNVKNGAQVQPGANMPLAITGGRGVVPTNFAGGTTDLSTSTAPGQLGGIAQQLYTALLGVAQNYLLYNPANPASSLMGTSDVMKFVDQYMQGYTGSGSSGLVNQFVNNAAAQFTQEFAIPQAKSLYPTLATAIDQGTAPSTYIQPTANYVASQLGMSQGSINVLDPQWNWIISTPGQDGIKGPVTQDQALQKITNPDFHWTDPNGKSMNYMQTNNGIAIGNQFSQAFDSAFGKGA